MNNTTRSYKINLNHLSVFEYGKYPDTFEEYKGIVKSMLDMRDIFLFEDDILDEYSKDVIIRSELDGKPITMEYLKQHLPGKFVGAGHRRKNKNDKNYTNIWHDLCMDYEIKPDVPFYDVLFYYYLRHVDFLEVDAFLNYTLEEYYQGDFTLFARFIQLAFRKQGKKILTPEYIQTVNEWVAFKERESAFSGIEKPKTKGKAKRERDDNVTKLNQEQTALLIHFLQIGRIILRDESLNNKEAGQAFSILTGYSADSLRQNLSKAELQRITTKKNFDAIANAFTSLQLLIDREIKSKK